MKKVLASFLFLFFVIGFFGCGTPKEVTVGKGNEGLLMILCKPSDAEVFVNGVSMGEANRFDGKPGYIMLESGTHKIEIKKEGYAPYFREVFSSRSLQTIDVTLIKLK